MNEYEARTETMTVSDARREWDEVISRVSRERMRVILDANGAPLKARLVVPSVPAKLDLTFLSTARVTFAPDIWTAHQP